MIVLRVINRARGKVIYKILLDSEKHDFVNLTSYRENQGDSPWIPWFPSSPNIYILFLYPSEKKIIYKRGEERGIRIYKEFRLFYIEFSNLGIRGFHPTYLRFLAHKHRIENQKSNQFHLIWLYFPEYHFTQLSLMRHPFGDTVTSPYKRRVERIHLTRRLSCPVHRTKGTQT